MLSRTVLQWHYEVHTNITNVNILTIHSTTHYTMKDLRAMEAVFYSDLMKAVLSKLLMPCTDHQLLAAEE